MSDLEEIKKKIYNVSSMYLNRWRDDQNVIDIIRKVTEDELLDYLNSKEWGIVPINIRNDLGINEDELEMFNEYLKENNYTLYEVSDIIIKNIYNEIKGMQLLNQ
jgi:hypothetical protein